MTTRARSLVKPSAKAALGPNLLAAQRHNLEVAGVQNDRVIVEAAKLLRKAGHVHVAGFRSCYPVAFGLVYAYRLFRSSVSLLTGEAGTLEMQLRGIDRRSATIVVSYAPYSAEAVRVAQAAHEQGSRLIAVTDSAVAPVALNADKVLIFGHDGPSFFPSMIGATAIAESLVAHLLALEGDGAVTALEKAETELYGKGAYID